MTPNQEDAAPSAQNAQPAPAPFGAELELRMVCILVGLFLVATATTLLTAYSGLIDTPPSAIWVCASVAAAGGIISCVPQFWRGTSRSGSSVSIATFIFLTAFAGLVSAGLVCISSLESIHREKGLKTAWNLERSRFEKSAEGFPVLQRVAREQFGLELVLGTDEDSYQATTHQAPGASVGLMTVLPGYCALGLWPVGIAREFPVESGDTAFPDQRSVLGVAFHELGHCVDESRDQASFKDPHVGTASIAPGDRAGVKDIQTYVVAERKVQTKLWREIYADLFAVGYVGLEWKGDAPVFQRALLNERIAHAPDDPTHATACWIQAALKASPPDSLATLSQWADARRASAPCELLAAAASAKG